MGLQERSRHHLQGGQGERKRLEVGLGATQGGYYHRSLTPLEDLIRSPSPFCLPHGEAERVMLGRRQERPRR